MNRRDFMILTAAVSIALPVASRAAEAAAYSPELLAAELAAGKTVFLDFKAVWCSTCAAQARVLADLKAENPAYEQSVSFIDVDWDTWYDSDIVRQMNIPRRSTLLVLRGDQELGRIVAGTAKAEIKALMDAALQAATA